MRYGTTLVALALINVFTIFSGFPSPWKQGIITASSIIILLIGWIIRATIRKKTPTKTVHKRHKTTVTDISNMSSSSEPVSLSESEIDTTVTETETEPSDERS